MEATSKLQTQMTSTAGLLSSANASLQAGDRENAYLMSLEATRREPENIETWLLRYHSAPSREEKLLCLSQVVRLTPDHPLAKQNMYTTLWAKLKTDPFLAYIEETDQLYFVRGTDYQSLAVPKDRSIPQIYPPVRPKPLARAYKILGFAFLGLALAGLGTLLLAPVAVWLAFGAMTGPLKLPDRRRAWIVIFLSGLLLVVGLLLGFLFLTHFIQ